MSNQSSPDNEWLDSRYPKGGTSPAHLDERIRAAAHDAVKPRLARWYGMGAAAVIVLAVMLTFVERDSPRDMQDLMSSPMAKSSGPAEADVAGKAMEPFADTQATGVAPSAGAEAPAPIAAQELAPRLAKFAAQAEQERAAEGRSMARTAAPPALEEIVVTGARIAADQTTSRPPLLPSCGEKPSGSDPVFCRADDGSMKILDPKSGDCPAELPVRLAGSDARGDLEVVSDDPRTIQVNEDEYVCHEKAWVPKQDLGPN